MTSAPPAISVIGNLNIDLIIRGITELPGWGQEVAGSGHAAVTAGQAGNLAMALSHLGMAPSLIATVGHDSFGRQILGDLTAAGVDTAAVALSERGQTGLSVGIVRPDGERAFVSDFASLREFDETVVRRHWTRVEGAAIVCLVGLFCLPGLRLSAATRLMHRARAAGQQTMLDPGWGPGQWPAATIRGIRELLGQIDIFLPNLDEAAVITGLTTAAEASAALQAAGLELVVIKQGAAGSYSRRGAESATALALPVAVVDTVGAGDVFDAGFLYALRQEWGLKECLLFGNASAALYVSRATNRFPAASEVATAVERLRRR